MKSGFVPSRSALLALQRATHATLQVLVAELAELELTASEINVLGNLADGRARTVSGLGAAVGSRSSTLTGVLDRLERRGLVTRTASATDRRSLVVELTAGGRDAAASVRRTVTALERRALRPLPPDAVAGFHAVLAALTEVPA